METISLKPERKAQVDGYARRHGQDADSALDDVLATYLELENQDSKNPQPVSGVDLRM